MSSFSSPTWYRLADLHTLSQIRSTSYLVNLGTVSWLTYFLGFMLPTLIGNIIGGVSLVAALNFAQVASEVIGNM